MNISYHSWQAADCSQVRRESCRLFLSWTLYPGLSLRPLYLLQSPEEQVRRDFQVRATNPCFVSISPYCWSLTVSGFVWIPTASSAQRWRIPSTITSTLQTPTCCGIRCSWSTPSLILPHTTSTTLWWERSSMTAQPTDTASCVTCSWTCVWTTVIPRGRLNRFCLKWWKTF